jgi:hypothetical protein
MPFANVSKSQEEIEAEEEEILRKYGGEDSEEENDAEPGKIIISLHFQCLSRLLTLGIQDTQFIAIKPPRSLQNPVLFTKETFSLLIKTV